MKKTENRNIITRVAMIVAAMLIILTIVTSMPAMAATTKFPVGSQCYANVSDSLNLHKAPQDHEYIGQIKKGWTVTILEGPTRDDYYYVRIDKTGQTGWAYGGDGLLKPVVNEPSAQTTKKPTTNETRGTQSYEECTDLGAGMLMTVVSEKKLNVRKGPAKDKYRIEYLYNGDVVEVLDGTVKNNYVKVRTPSGKEGYVDLTYLVYGTLEDQEQDWYLPCTCGCECCK